MNAVHYRLQSDIIYNFWGIQYNTSTQPSNIKRPTQLWIRSMCVILKWLPNVTYQNYFITIQIHAFVQSFAFTRFVPSTLKHTHTHYQFSNRSAILYLFFFRLPFFCISGVLKWNGISIFATISLKYIVCASISALGAHFFTSALLSPGEYF